MPTAGFDSDKQEEFVTAGLKDSRTQEFKCVTSIGGIGKVAGDKFKADGIEFAYNLVGQFMVFCCDEDLMDEYLATYITQSNRRASAVKTVRMWCDRQL